MKKNGLLCYVNRILCLLLCAALSAHAAGCASQDHTPVSMNDIFFDTVITITLYDYPGSSADILDKCKEKCDQFESLFSPTIEGSDIWNINHAESFPVQVNPDTAKMLMKAIDYGNMSGGLIDITIGALTDIWDIREQSAIDDPVIPSPEVINEALSHVDYTSVIISPAPGANSPVTDSQSDNSDIPGSAAPSSYEITLTDPDARIEPGCIAKGYIADELKSLLINEGVSSAIINLGGNILVIGSKPDGTPFNIGIQYPFKDRGESIETVSISDTSVVSSGTYERYFTLNDQVYHHILDPRTGYPSDSGVISASVRCASSVDADALSTLCLILGEQEGLSLIESIPDTEVLFVTEGYELVGSSGW